MGSARSWQGACALGLALMAAGCAHAPPKPPPPARTDQPLSLSLPLFPDGTVHALESDRGNVVLLEVWATWCEPCRDLLPVYEKLAREYGPSGLKVYAISLDEDAAQIERFVKKTQLSIPVLRDQEDKAERVLGVELVPTTFLLDRRGVVRHISQGASDDVDAALAVHRAQIEALLAEKP